MGQFFKSVLASCLGIFLAVLVIAIIGGAVITSLALQADKPEKVSPNSILHLTFDQLIPEQTNNLQMDPFDFQQQEILGLQEILHTLKKAKTDDNIKGVFLELESLPSTGLATAAQLREALLDFKSEGKFIIAYSDYYSQGAYYLASTADELYANPLGMIDLRGFSAQIPFFKDMLDKIGVEMQIYYAGKFKSATEPYRLDKMSEENRFQVREYINEIYAHFLSDIATSRNIPLSDLQNMANNYTGLNPMQAAEMGMIDKVGYRDDAIKLLKEKLGLEEKDKIKLFGLESYHATMADDTDFKIKDKIAVIYAEGTIVDGEGDPGSVGDDKYVEFIREIRQSDRIKAIVLRVNSPGGSALSSENIWYELSLAKAKGIPIVVSMGDYAASGGYYIAAAADSIFAQPNTLTGSIGVFMMIPNAAELLNDKLGIAFDTVKTAQYAEGITPFYPISASEGALLQERTESMYDIFLSRVAEGRKISKEEVHQIAQGRVWTGQQAQEIGLVDQIGDLNRAIESAAELASLASYRITSYPKVKDPWQQMLEEWFGMEKVSTDKLLQAELGSYYPYWSQIKEMVSNQTGVQARLPLFIPFE
ncbi:MAG TPA: signal peptide peptidase SppA [Saprospiraceae bacterium]|nr:signal peptide peptidase SppA [Saprospiraceae bacterium]HMQ81807.1 signal peptide peptidase SppA [Saprospiraceae bacterium]